MATWRQTGNKLVELLARAGYQVVGHQAAFVLREHGQAMMNKAAGEAAPTWELRVDPMVYTTADRIQDAGDNPLIRHPDGTTRQREVGSHLPVAHILAAPAAEVSVRECDMFDRLLIDTEQVPEQWLRQGLR